MANFKQFSPLFYDLSFFRTKDRCLNIFNYIKAFTFRHSVVNEENAFNFVEQKL